MLKPQGMTKFMQKEVDSIRLTRCNTKASVENHDVLRASEVLTR